MKKLTPLIMTIAIAILLCITLWTGWVYISKPPLDTSDWDFLEYQGDFAPYSRSSDLFRSEVARSGHELSRHRFKNLDFEEAPLEEVLDFLMSEINSQLHDKPNWTYKIIQNESELDWPLTYYNESVRADFALQYIVAFSGMESSITGRRELTVYPPLTTVPLGPVEEADFLYPTFHDPAKHDKGNGPYDVRSEFVGRSGISFEANDLEFAQYFPRELRIRVRGSSTSFGGN